MEVGETLRSFRNFDYQERLRFLVEVSIRTGLKDLRLPRLLRPGSIIRGAAALLLDPQYKSCDLECWSNSIDTKGHQ